MNDGSNPTESKSLDVLLAALHIRESTVEHCARMAGNSPTALDVLVNIAQAKAEKTVERRVDQRLKRARDIISAARNIAVSIVGMEAAGELLENEFCAVHEEIREKAMMRKLKGA